MFENIREKIVIKFRQW